MHVVISFVVVWGDPVFHLLFGTVPYPGCVRYSIATAYPIC